MFKYRIKELDDIDSMAEDVVEISAKENTTEIIDKASAAAKRVKRSISGVPSLKP